MAYQDPYAGQYGRHEQQQHPHVGGQDDSFNPYANNNQQPYETYEQGDYTGGAYRDEPVSNNNNNYGVQRQPTNRSYAAPVQPGAPSGLEHDDPFTPREKQVAPNLKAYRYETQGNLWTRGSRVGCIGRFFCCTIMIIFFLLVSIILALALWIRPPAVLLGTPDISGSSSDFTLLDSGITIPFNLNVSVSNPNYFSVGLKKVKTELIYPINNTDIGGGTTTNVNFPSHSNKTVEFPFSIDYTLASDPNYAILLDLAQKCGIIGTASDITIKYKITISIRILIITVSPTISNSFSFSCPLDSSDLEDLLKNAGIDDISSILGSS